MSTTINENNVRDLGGLQVDFCLVFESCLNYVISFSFAGTKLEYNSWKYHKVQYYNQMAKPYTSDQ